MRRIRKSLIKFAALCLGLVLAILLAEGLATAVAYYQYRTIDVAELHTVETGNQYLTDFQTEKGGYVAGLHPHPYLGFVHNKLKEKSSSGYIRINNIGLLGRDFPLKKDESFFTIMLSGGSVASEFCRCGEDSVCYLEQILNERYDFEKPVIVLNGGNGAWKQPQQSILLLMYGHAVDAIVTLDGFNEHWLCRGGKNDFPKPGSSFHKLNPILHSGFDYLGKAWQTDQLRQFSFRHKWRSVYFATLFLRKQITPEIEESLTEGVSVESFFSLPDDWSREERRKYNLQQYAKYIRLMSAMANELDLKKAFFIQPCPAIGKKLTKEEQSRIGALDYADSYQLMIDELMQTQEPIVSLVNVFSEHDETIYADIIHCESTRDTSKGTMKQSTGYRVMAEAIANHLTTLWKIPPKQTR